MAECFIPARVSHCQFSSWIRVTKALRTRLARWKSIWLKIMTCRPRLSQSSEVGAKWPHAKYFPVNPELTLLCLSVHISSHHRTELLENCENVVMWMSRIGLSQLGRCHEWSLKIVKCSQNQVSALISHKILVFARAGIFLHAWFLVQVVNSVKCSLLTRIQLIYQCSCSQIKTLCSFLYPSRGHVTGGQVWDSPMARPCSPVTFSTQIL